MVKFLLWNNFFDNDSGVNVCVVQLREGGYNPGAYVKIFSSVEI